MYLRVPSELVDVLGIRSMLSRDTPVDGDHVLIVEDDLEFFEGACCRCFADEVSLGAIAGSIEHEDLSFLTGLPSLGEIDA
jgi:hypothetical protein